MTDKNRNLLITVIGFIITAALFGFGGYFLALKLNKPSENAFIEAEKQTAQDSLNDLKEDYAALYEKWVNRPDIKKETEIKYKTITKTLYEKVYAFDIAPADEKLDHFANMLHKLPSYKSDSTYLNSIQSIR